MISEGLEAVRHPIEIRTQEGLAAAAESLPAGPGKKIWIRFEIISSK
jgi:hypothetical protein